LAVGVDVGVGVAVDVGLGLGTGVAEGVGLTGTNVGLIGVEVGDGTIVGTVIRNGVGRKKGFSLGFETTGSGDFTTSAVGALVTAVGITLDDFIEGFSNSAELDTSSEEFSHAANTIITIDRMVTKDAIFIFMFTNIIQSSASSISRI
tara:strand:- start:173 stop:616 length:444 start_codon:yes stop_codon:yes gene_type:complete